MNVAEQVEEIRQRMAESAHRAGRSPAAVVLVAVCKRQPLARIAAACDAGVTHLGESTAQGLGVTALALAREDRKLQWHFVGRLQRNKIAPVLAHGCWIHSVGDLVLASAIDRRAERDGVAQVDVLVQVNVGREAHKGGVAPERAVELACAAAELPHLRMRGLMTLPPGDEDPRPHFATLRRLSETLCATPECRGASELSMGMSDDFEAAIEHGATLVRVGTALFGQRTS